MMFFTSHSLRNHRGLTLLEAALVLTILGLVISGIWLLSGTAMGSIQKSRLAEQVIASVEGVRSYVRNTDLPVSGGVVLSMDQLWNLGILPNDIGSSYKNPFNGSFEAQVIYSSANFHMLYIGLGNIPSDACVDLIYSRLGGTGAAAEDFGFIGYKSNLSFGTGGINSDLSLSTVTNSCNSSSNLMLVFRAR